MAGSVPENITPSGLVKRYFTVDVEVILLEKDDRCISHPCRPLTISTMTVKLPDG
jgi:hypothetical protein